MKKRLKLYALTLLVLTCVTMIVRAEFNPPPIEWQRTFGGTNDDRLRTLQQTSDGGFILGGFSDSSPSGNKSSTNFGGYDFWIIRTDASGNKLWDASYGSTNEDVLYSVRQTSDGGFILGGYTTNTGPSVSGNKTATNFGNYDFWVVRTDSNGNKLWDKSFGGADFDQLRVLRQTSNGGFILGGQSFSAPGGNKTNQLYGTNDFWVVRIDGNGNKLWDKAYGGTGADRLQDLQQTADGGFILGGVSLSPASGNKTNVNYGLNDLWLVRVDANGNKLWDKSYGGTENDELLSLDQTSDGGFVLGGFSFSDVSGNKTNANFGPRNPAPSTDFWIVRTDANGNKLWDRSYGGTADDSCRGVEQTPDGGFILGGATSSGVNGNKTSASFGVPDFWVARTDSNGNKLWDKTYGGTGDDGIWGLQQTADGGFIFGGGSNSTPGGNKTSTNYGLYDYWIVKIGADAPKLRTAAQTLQNIRTNGFRFFLSGISNNNYRTDYSTNLANWIPLQTNQLIGTELQISDLRATNSSFRSYRAVLLP